ncbi:MAG TPA: hypothetical protein VL382_11785, partial [Terriglobales bacterium]|nr:hypothetical protein [Terriglobales bacterium]
MKKTLCSLVLLAAVAFAQKPPVVDTPVQRPAAPPAAPSAAPVQADNENARHAREVIDQMLRAL